MMNLKKYRAATTRDALELVKQDLGADAFVIETRRVTSRGFLGLGSKNQIEVSAAVPPESVASLAAPTAAKQARQSFPNISILDLKDESPAQPERALLLADEPQNKVFETLALRTEQDNILELDDSQARSARNSSRIETVEVSPFSPRIVHPKRDVPKSPTSAMNEEQRPTNESDPQPFQRRELDMLRAELREVKHSLDVFSRQQRDDAAIVDTGCDDFSEVADPPFRDVYMMLTERGFSAAFARRLITEIIPAYRDGKIAACDLSLEAVRRGLAPFIKFATADASHGAGQCTAVIGPTGVGKTTTIAKLAARAALYDKKRVELVTLDTYRIAAVEQLKTYAEIIGAGCHVVRSVFELDATIRRLPEDATVFIDTTGRSPLALADQYELADYLYQHPSIRKCLAIQATTHPADVSDAIRKFGIYGADRLVVTKFDETVRPGLIMEEVAKNGIGLSYLCTGQRVPEDLKLADMNSLAELILR